MSIPGILKNTLPLPLLFLALLSWAQPKDNSPYSRLGLGDFVPQTMVSQMGSGSWGAALHDPFHLNLLNPASFAFLASTSYDIGLYAKYARLKGGDEAADVWSGNLRYLALAFPLQNPVNQSLDKKDNPFKWGMGFALTPFTNVGYDIQTTEILPGVDTTTNIYRGTGGTYKLTWSNGWRYKNLAAGVNLAYFFGKMNYARQVIFDDLGVAYQTLFDDAVSVSGVTWDAGLQYVILFKKENEEGQRVPSGKRLVFGATAHTPTAFRTNSSRLYRGFNFSYPDGDTVVNETGVIQQGRLPMEWSAGLMFESGSKWRLGAEYRFSQWSLYDNEAKPETFNDTWRLAGGVEFIPDANSYNRYSRRIRYKMGGFYGTDPRSYKTELRNYGLTMGVGLPLLLPRQQVSFVHAALEVGFFGAPGELRETYGRLSLSFTLNDNSWFFKRKFF